MGDVNPRRRYRSVKRQEQAAATRQAILDATRRLFIERGYTGTTIEAIAGAADVAPITVYATFRTKRRILDRLLEVSLVGDQEPVPLLERPGPKAVRAERDQRRQVAMFAADIAEIMGRISPVIEVMRNAAAVEAEIADRLDRLHRERLQGQRVFVDALAANGPLRLDPAAATETVWALCSPDLHRLVTVRLGWGPERYTEWLRDLLVNALLA